MSYSNEVKKGISLDVNPDQPHIKEAKDAICLVLYDDRSTQEKKTATGALCCIPLKNNNSLCGLLTCYHVLPFTHDPATLTNLEIRNTETGNIQQHVILPNYSHISSIFTCKLLDVTFIAFDNALVRDLKEEGFHFHKKFAQENDIIHYLYQYSNTPNELLNIEGREIEEHGVNITHKMFRDNVNEGGVIINKQGEFYAFHNTKYNNVNYGTKFSCIIDAIFHYYIVMDNLASYGIKLPKQIKALPQAKINAIYNKFGLRPVIDTNGEENLIFKSEEYVKPTPHDTCRVWVCRTPYCWYYAEMSLKHKVEGLQWSNQDLDFVGKLKMFPWMPIWSNDNHIDVSGYANDMARILYGLMETKTSLICTN